MTKTNKRGKASSDAQLSAQQESFLLWMLDQEPRENDLSSIISTLQEELTQAAYKVSPLLSREVIDAIRSEAIRRTEYAPTALPWNAAKFLGRSPTESEQSSLNRAVRSLEARGLLSRSRGRVSFSKEGRLTAELAKQFKGVSVRQMLKWERVQQSAQRIEAFKFLIQLLQCEAERVGTNERKLFEERQQRLELHDREEDEQAGDEERRLEGLSSEVNRAKTVVFDLILEEHTKMGKRLKSYEASKATR